MQRFLAICVAVLALLNPGAEVLGQPRPLAPGVLKIIPANIDVRDSHSLPLPLLGLESENYSPNFAPMLDTLHGQTKNVVFFRDVWQYEFGFLSLRQISIKLPGSNSPENVWYMVYRIRNTGSNVSYDHVQKADSRHVNHELQTNKEDFEIKSKFIPHFYLNGWIKTSGEYQRVSYLDQIDQDATAQIRAAEDRNRVLFDKVAMMNAKFPVVKSSADDGIWGVAVWRNVDPRIDYVSVQVRGLTNAYRIHTTADGERKFKYRNLQLNFWRPGDTVRQDEDEITFGIPLVDDPIRQIEICEKYELPGPLVRGYVKSPSADQDVLVVEMDAKVQFTSFKSSVTPPLDEGKLPAEIRAEFAKAGISIPQNVKVTQEIPEQKWSLTGKVDDEDRSLIIELEPQYWEPKGEGIRFINSLEYLWTYR